ncbi:unnamed protein product [Cunninghamella echinulata]
MTCYEPINHTHPTNALTPFSIMHESNEQKNYVKSLVDMVAHTINTIWPQPISKNTTNTSTTTSTASLMTFLQHILKHSRTTHSTLQLALFYLFRIRPRMTNCLDQLSSKDRPYVLCGRRMFLASLLSAHKYLQDKTYKNKAWTSISGLPVDQINHSERVFLYLLDYQLYIKKETYDHWLTLVQHQIGKPCPLSSNNHHQNHAVSMMMMMDKKKQEHHQQQHKESTLMIPSSTSLENTPSTVNSDDHEFCQSPVTPIMNNNNNELIYNKKRKMNLDSIMTTTTTITTNPTIHFIPTPPMSVDHLPTPPSESEHILPPFSTGEKRKWSYLQ